MKMASIVEEEVDLDCREYQLMGRRKVLFPELRSVLGEEEEEAKVWSSWRASALIQSIVRQGAEKKTKASESF